MGLGWGLRIHILVTLTKFITDTDRPQFSERAEKYSGCCERFSRNIFCLTPNLMIINGKNDTYYKLSLKNHYQFNIYKTSALQKKVGRF